MPKRLEKFAIFRPVSDQEAKDIFDRIDWQKLEDALGNIKLSAGARRRILANLCLMNALRDGPPITVLRRKIRLLGKRAHKLRDLMGAEDQVPVKVMKSPKSTENYFMRLPKAASKNDSASAPQFLVRALSMLIAATQIAEREVTVARTGMSREKWVCAFGDLIRTDFEELGLPFTVRKDTDKMFEKRQRSPFARFYYELLSQIGSPKPATVDALAQALHRAFRDNKAQK